MSTDCTNAKNARPRRVGFLFNHFALHQVAHSAPYAFELSILQPEIEVIICCSSVEQEQLIHRIAALYPGQTCQFMSLQTPRYYRCIAPFHKPWRLRKKNFILSHNRRFFRTLDALVSPELHCLKLRSKYGVRELQIIYAHHGAGDREGSFNHRMQDLGFNLLPGQKYLDTFEDRGLIENSQYGIAGYPKFDVVMGLKPKVDRLFKNDHPVIIYNPHFDQSVSSWKHMGLEVLEFFATHPEYNLIFAPHLVMFARAKKHGAYLPSHFADMPNILIDTGSLASTDMTYVRAADIYLGDVSSQVYEFLLEPRPCVFLNGHGVSWRDNPYFANWQLGQVVDHLDQLKTALDRAESTHPEYRAKQQAAFDYTFHSEEGSTAAQRGAKIIKDYVVSL